MVSAYCVFTKLSSRNLIDSPYTFRSVVTLELIVLNRVNIGIKISLYPAYGYPAPFVKKIIVFTMQCSVIFVSLIMSETTFLWILSRLLNFVDLSNLIAS